MKIKGVIPAGGQSLRMHGFPKEMMPIGVDRSDSSKFIVSSEKVIQSMLLAGASQVEFVLTRDKEFIQRYYSAQQIYPDKIVFSFLDKEAERLGMPYTITSTYASLSEADIVLMGMPDTVIEPSDAFGRGIKLLKAQGADLALGLFKTDYKNKGGYIEFDHVNKSVRSHIDKVTHGFPEEANNAWGIAVWGKRFTGFMQDYLQGQLPLSSLHSNMIFGSLIDAALQEKGIRVVADFIDDRIGFYWDFADPQKYFDFLNIYYRSDFRDPKSVPDQNRANYMKTQNIFISGGQVGAVGENFQSNGSTLSQPTITSANALDLALLSRQLEELLSNLKEQATDPSQYHALASVASAVESAKANDKPGTLKHLQKAGKWAFDVATKIETSVAAKAIEEVLLAS